MSALTQSIKQKVYEVNELLTQLETEEARQEADRQNLSAEHTRQVMQIKQVLGINTDIDEGI